MIPMREPFWNIGDVRTIVHLLMVIPLLFLVYGVWLHFNLWRLGKKGKTLKQIPRRMVSFVSNVFLHRRILKDRYAGLMHLFIFWGFLILFLGTVAVFLQDSIVGRVLSVNFLQGRFYVFFKFMLDLSGILVCGGISMAIYRRYILKPSKLISRREDTFVFSLIFLIILSGFSLEGLRFSVTKPPESHWSPVGFVFALVFENIFLQSWRLTFHQTLWWMTSGPRFLFYCLPPSFLNSFTSFLPL